MNAIWLSCQWLPKRNPGLPLFRKSNRYLNAEPGIAVRKMTAGHLSSDAQLTGAKPAAGSAKSGGGSIRVDTAKIDSLINMVGELVITQSMLGMLGEDFDMSRVEKLNEGLSQLERHTRELQESVMQIRMLPISFTFSRFPRLVHDLSTKMGKKIELEMIW